MEINISLPSSSSLNTFKEMKGYLKQLELALHHAQKSVESAEEQGITLTDDSFICFRHRSLPEKEQDDLYDELQHIELQINLQ